MFDAAATASDALAALVDASGAAPGLVLVKVTPGTYNRATATVSAVETSFAAVGLVFDFDLTNSGAGSYDSTLIADGDRRAYLAALKADGSALPTPAKGDRLVGPDGAPYHVERVKTLAPTGIAILFDVQLRRHPAVTRTPALETESGADLMTEDGSRITLEP